MLSRSKTFSPAQTSELPAQVSEQTESRRPIWLQVAIAYLLIEVVLWTPPGWIGLACMALALLCIVWLSMGSRFSTRAMGITTPTLAGTMRTVAVGAALAVCLPLVSGFFGLDTGPAHVPFRLALVYAVWALVQQFVVQSFFFVRMEVLLGARRGVLASALLFALAHLPNPVLTLGTFIGGLFFSEMFRRYRSIFPLGFVHAMLGLTIAASFSDGILRHMYVGAAYLMVHP